MHFTIFRGHVAQDHARDFFDDLLLEALGLKEYEPNSEKELIVSGVMVSRVNFSSPPESQLGIRLN